MIVALLCLTLFVDSAKACWWLRQHRSRGQVCQPAACQPAWSLPCTDVPVESPTYALTVVDDPAACCCDATTVEHASADAAVDHDAVAPVIEHATAEHTSRADDSVVVHGPTMVIDAAPAPHGDAEPASVVTQPAADAPVPPVAQPMPVAAVGPTVLPSPTPAQEPFPNLKPVAPASNEQPMTEPPATAAAQVAEAAAEAADEHDADAPMPAPADALAGGPTIQPPIPEPKEPNLFDLYGDEDEVTAAEEAPGEEAPIAAPPEMADDDAGEPAEDAAAEAAPSEEAEMTEDDAEPAEAEAADGDSEMADEAAPAEEPAAEEADAAPEAAAEQTEADPADAAVTVPNEPMRRWTDESGTHHTRGWLVAVRADRVRILKVNGRHTTVLTESLSAADRDYVSAVGARLAAEGQGTSPAPTATAGL